MAGLDDIGLQLRLPIIQAPMAGVQDSALALAVSEAGGLGSLPAAMLAPDVLARELGVLASRPELPFNVNFFCHQPPAPDAGRDEAWRRLLADYYAHLGLDMTGIPTAAGRRPFDAAAADLLEAQPVRPAVISFHFGLPEPALLERVRRLGVKVFSSATTVEEGVWLEANGVDAVIAQGLEAGGHRGHFLRPDLDLEGQQDTVALLDALLARLKLPVIAAGGITNRERVRAVLDRGAAAAQVGTAYLLCREARTTAPHRAALTALAERQRADAAAATLGSSATAITNLFSGRPARGIVNRLIRECGPINAAAPAFPLAGNAIGPLRARAEADGSGEFSPLWSGVDARGCEPLGAGDLTRNLAG